MNISKSQSCQSGLLLRLAFLSPAEGEVGSAWSLLWPLSSIHRGSASTVIYRHPSRNRFSHLFLSNCTWFFSSNAILLHYISLFNSPVCMSYSCVFPFFHPLSQLFFTWLLCTASMDWRSIWDPHGGCREKRQEASCSPYRKNFPCVTQLGVGVTSGFILAGIKMKTWLQCVKPGQDNHSWISVDPVR